MVQKLDTDCDAGEKYMEFSMRITVRVQRRITSGKFLSLIYYVVLESGTLNGIIEASKRITGMW